MDVIERRKAYRALVMGVVTFVALIRLAVGVQDTVAFWFGIGPVASVFGLLLSIAVSQLFVVHIAEGFIVYIHGTAPEKGWYWGRLREAFRLMWRRR